MTHNFRDWIACPACDEQDDVSTLAYKTEVVFECYDCGRSDAYEIGEDVPLRSLDGDAIGNRTTEGT